MNKLSLDALAREHLGRARQTEVGRSSESVFGGHETVLRQTLVALVEGAGMGEHASPGEATLHVLSGRVRLTAGDTAWEGRAGDLVIIPDRPHELAALKDSAVLLTVAVRR